MNFLSFTGKKDTFGIIVDIGSGSVLVSIVHSSSDTDHPIILWAHREHIALQKIDSVQHSAKAVMSALMSASMKLDSEGRAILREYNSSAKLSVMQCSIAAPWSYTVTKSINLQQSEKIEITDNFIEELVYTAQKQVEEELKSHVSELTTGLTVIVKATMDLLSNGYRVKNPVGEQTNSLNLTQATVVAQEYVMNGLSEVHNKLFAASELRPVSFILLLYCTTRSLHPQTDDICLVDITDEASEIGIVRDGSLKYSTHTPFGMFSLAREIAEVSGSSIHEALGFLRADDIAGVKKHIGETKHDAITKIFDAYLEKLADLLNETGDSLSIPKRIYVHVEESFEPLFMVLIARAARSATKIDHQTISLAKEIIPTEHRAVLQERIGDYVHDTALLLNAEFFHKPKHCLDFNYS